MKDRAPSSVWGMRRLGADTNGSVWTTPDDQIAVIYHGVTGSQSIVLPRKDARLLAKRINQCLDATVKK